MKLRTGFVSNSSSSSFLIPKEDYQNSFTLAKAMIEIRNREWEEKDYNKEIDLLNRAEAQGTDPDIEIRFPTCNYDTYIYNTIENGKQVYRIDTCNNHLWNDLQARITYVDEDDNNQLVRLIWFLPEDIFGYSVSYDETSEKEIEYFCKRHFILVIKIKDEIICPICASKLKKYNDHSLFRKNKQEIIIPTLRLR